MNDTFAATNIIIALLSFVLGTFAFVKNHKDPINLNWFLATFATGIWSLSLAAVVLSKNYATANLWQYLLDMASIWSPIFFFRFVLSVTGAKDKYRRWYKYSIIPGFFVTFFVLTPLFRSGMSKVFTFEYWVNPGLFYFVTPLVYAFFVFSSIFFIIKYQGKSRGSKKVQLTYILFVALVGFGGGMTNYLPQLFNLYPIGNYLVVFYVVFITYAIVKHRLMDIRIVAARSVTYAALLLILAGFYAGVILAAQAFIFPNASYSTGYIALQIALAIIMAFSFQPLRTWITKVTDKIFFKNSYDKDELLSELSHMLGSTIVLIEMLYKVSDILTREMKASRTLFALIKDEDRLYTVQANGYKATPEVDPRDILHITRDGLMIADEMADNSTHKRLLRQYDAAIAIPLKTEKEVVGVLLLGEKSSGDMYSQQDLAVLEIIAPEISVAIENAKSYEEINRFNVTLRQEVKHATSRLKLKNEQLMELDKAKDEFISMASHQLRTPLTAIKGYLSMLLEGDAGDIKVSQYDFINEAYSGANRMVGLINDLLNVSRMETGRFFLEPKELDIERVVEEEIKQLSNAAKTKGLYLKVEKKGKVPHIWADETKIRQVVMNFMDNAIYYTNTGGITVVLRHDKKDFIYEVHDTGIGVPRTQLEHLFEKFFRADNARTARPDGTGLGIYLAKRVVEDHGGEIIFDSVEGKGSMFGFRFPLKKKIESKPISTPEAKVVSPAPSMPMATEIAEKNTGE